jgi:hypothetical protein
MKILVLNCGSSSIKYKLFDMDSKEVIAQGGIEKIGLKGSFLKFTLPNGEKKILEKDIPEHTVGVEFILHTLTDPEYGAIKSMLWVIVWYMEVNVSANPYCSIRKYWKRLPLATIWHRCITLQT